MRGYQQIEDDTFLLNTWNYPPDSIPVFEDSVIKSGSKK